MKWWKQQETDSVTQSTLYFGLWGVTTCCSHPPKSHSEPGDSPSPEPWCVMKRMKSSPMKRMRSSLMRRMKSCLLQLCLGLSHRRAAVVRSGASEGRTLQAVRLLHSDTWIFISEWFSHIEFIHRFNILMIQTLKSEHIITHLYIYDQFYHIFIKHWNSLSCFHRTQTQSYQTLKYLTKEHWFCLHLKQEQRKL